MSLHVLLSNVFSRIVTSESLAYNSFFLFQNSRFTEKLFDIDSHTNTVISHADAHSSRWLPNRDKVSYKVHYKEYPLPCLLQLIMPATYLYYCEVWYLFSL